MIDYLLLGGRLLLIVLLYLFLFVLMKTGIGLVKGQNKKAKQWSISVVKGPRTLQGIKLNVAGPLVVGRASGADIVIPTSFVSGRHARFSPMGTDLLVEDLGSTNGTLLNGQPVSQPTPCKNGDIVSVGDVEMKIGHA